MIHRQRVTLKTLFSILTPYQSMFVDKTSRIVVHESTDLDYTSSDRELDNGNEWKSFELAASRMVASQDRQD